MSEIEEAIRRQMLAERAAVPETSVAGPPPAPERHGVLRRWEAGGGVLGGIATLVILLLKLGAPLLGVLVKLKGLLVGLKVLPFAKVFLTGGSMFVSMLVYGVSMGWAFGVALVLLIFVHECGHAFAGKMRGIPIGSMVFVPGMGALVTLKRSARNIVDDAFIGIMGPLFGTLAGVACVGIYYVTGSPFWLAVAYFDFFINLFNLLPTPPLDGGWITPLFSPKLLAAGVVLLFVVAPGNPLIWILAIMSLPRIAHAWRARPEDQPYYRASAADRWRYGLLYLGLALFLVVGKSLLMGHLAALGHLAV